MNEGADRKQVDLTEAVDYRDVGRGVALHKDGMGILGIGLRIALQVDGLSNGFSQPGQLRLTSYKSGFGMFEDQELDWTVTLHQPTKSHAVDYVLCRVRGTIKNTANEPLQVDYKFQVDNDPDGFEARTIRLMGGQIQEGEKVYRVDED